MIVIFCTIGKNLTVEQLWKKVCSLIKEGHLPYCNAKLQVGTMQYSDVHVKFLTHKNPRRQNISKNNNFFKQNSFG